MRKILLIIGGLALLGGGGAGAYFMFFQKPAEAAVPEDEHAAAEEAHPEQKADAHGDPHGKAAGDAPTFVKFDPLVIPMMDNEGISQIIALDVTFEVVDQAAADKFEQLKPRLRDAMIQSLYGLLNHQVAMENGALRVGYVKERLNATATQVMGDGAIKDVLLQMVQQNPI